MKKVIIAATALSLGIIASHGATIIAGGGTFAFNGQTQNFNLFNGNVLDIQQIEIRLDHTMSQIGATAQNLGVQPTVYTASLASNYLALVAGGPVFAPNLAASETSGTIGVGVTHNFGAIADADGISFFINPGSYASYVGVGTGGIQGLFSSSFGVSASPSGTVAFNAGTGTIAYTWSVIYTVPEPSAALLGAVGLLALLRRRR